MTQPWNTPADEPAPWSPVPAEVLDSSRRRALPPAVLAVASALAVVFVAGTAWATFSFLSGGGAQPEDVLPAGTLALAKVDLDPAAGQKLAIFRLAQRFPTTSDDVTSADDVRDELLSALFADVPDLDYARDVAPWVGDRAALAAVPVPGGEPEPLAAVAFTDRAEADAALRRLTADDPESFFAFSERADYVLIGISRATVDAAAGASEVLADSGRFAGDVRELDGDQVVTAWADLDAVWQALPEELRVQADAARGVQPTGRVVVGGRATSDGVEVVGRAFGLSAGSPGSDVVGSTPGTGMVADLPADTVAALGVTGLGAGLAALYEQVAGGEDPLGIAEVAAATGLELPGDLEALFGQETVAAAFSGEDVAARSRSDDPDRALAVAETLVATFLLGDPFGGESFEQDVYVEGFDPSGEGSGGEGFESYEELLPPEDTTFGAVGRGLVELPAEQLRRLDDGVAVGTTGAAVDMISSGDGGLGGSELFRRAVPDADDAGVVLFVDLARAAELSSGTAPTGDAAVLEALGVTARGGQDGEFRLRLMVR